MTDEKDRANKFISSILFSRATIFHPSSRLTPKMKSKLVSIAQSGGTDINRPLESVKIRSYGKDFRVDLHVDYLLHPHRDILETLLAYALIIKLDAESYASGGRLSWLQVLSTLSNAQMSSTQPDAIQDGFDGMIDRDAIILSMSMYDLAIKLKIQPTRKNYEQIEQRIMQLSTAKLIVNELDDDNNIVDKKPLSFINDFRFCFDKKKMKNKRGINKCLTNHVFIIPDARLLAAIRDHGYYYRLEQHKITNYSTLSVRSFIKWLTTHTFNYLHTKRLSWAITEYIASIASPVSASFKSDLKRGILSNALQIEKDFNLQIKVSHLKDEQLFYTGETNETNNP